MSIIEPELDENDDNLGEENPNLRNLREKAKKADKLEKENEGLRDAQRELAFFRAGLSAEDLASPVGTLFAKGYDGDTEPEAIKAAWAEVSGAQAPPAETTEPPETSTDERRALSSDAQGDTGTTPPKPVRGRDGEAVKLGRSVLEDGGTLEDAGAVTFASLVNAAMDGDQSVIVSSTGPQV